MSPIYAGIIKPQSSGSAVVFEDNFNDNTRDVSKWAIGSYTTSDPLITVLEQNNRLEILGRAAQAVIGYNGYISNQSYNFTNKFAQIEVVSRGHSSANLRFGFFIDPDNYFMFINGTTGQWTLRKRALATNTDFVLNYNATTHRFIRLRHSTSDDHLHFEVSPDGATWSAARSSILRGTLVITNLKINIGGGTANSNASPQATIYDNFVSDLI